MVDGLLDVLKKQRDSTVSSNEISGQVKTHEKTYGREYRRLKSSMAYTCIWDQGFPTTEEASKKRRRASDAQRSGTPHRHILLR